MLDSIFQTTHPDTPLLRAAYCGLEWDLGGRGVHTGCTGDGVCDDRRGGSQAA